MKLCTKCDQEKPLTEFWRKATKSRDGYQPWCKVCSTEHRIDYYQKNKEREAANRDAWNADFRAWVRSLKEGRPCNSCRQTFPPKAMQWHHVDPSTKIDNVATLAGKRRSKQVILEEVAKCILLCAICHALQE